MSRVERGFWLLLGVWLVVLIFWQPQPPPLYTNVPSVNKDPDGFRIFYEMVAKQARSVQRTLRRPELLTDVDVLVLLRPSKGLEEDDREALMRWVKVSGGTLVVGYPIWNRESMLLENVFPEKYHGDVSVWEHQDAVLQTVTYVSSELKSPRDVESFTMKLRGKMALNDGPAQALVLSESGDVLVSDDAFGSGRVIQLADTALLGNEALGFKKSHLLAAALLDEIGRDRHWVFDESNEGVSIQPSLAPLIGAGPFRALFLYLLLFFIFWYWYKFRRHVRIHQPPLERDVREVTTLATDIGRFYFSANRTNWALSRYLAYFNRRLQLANMSPAERTAVQKTVKAAEEVNQTGQSSDAQLQMIRKLAAHRAVFRENQKDEG
jgi:hypothetical protein